MTSGKGSDLNCAREQHPAPGAQIVTLASKGLHLLTGESDEYKNTYIHENNPEPICLTMGDPPIFVSVKKTGLEDL